MAYSNTLGYLPFDCNNRLIFSFLFSLTGVITSCEMKGGVANAALDLGEADIQKDINARGIDLELHKVGSVNNHHTVEISSHDSGENVELEKVSRFSAGDHLEKFWSFISEFTKKNSFAVRVAVYIVMAILYNAYFIASVYYAKSNGIPIDWCDGVGFLIIITTAVYAGLLYFQVIKRFWGKTIYKTVIKPSRCTLKSYWRHRYAIACVDVFQNSFHFYFAD